MSLIKHKKVELTELFYDLVFVYAISQITTLIHHIHHGVVAPYDFFTFTIGLIIFVNSWMVQTVFTNRFGSNSLINICFMFAQMLCLLISSTAITSDWSQSFVPVILPMAVISLLLLAQYSVQYLFTEKESDRKLIRPFFFILGLRSISLLISVFLPYQVGLIVAVMGVLLTWIMPGIFNRNRGIKGNTTINFPHLIERLSLLVIITFGEMIIGIASYFSMRNLSLASFLIFLTVANLFMIYIIEIDHMIDTNQTNITGNGAIYYHYLIFFGLSFVTVALSFLGGEEAYKVFALLVLYLGIFLFMIGLLAHNIYNKASHRFINSLYCTELGLPLLSFVLSFLFLGNGLALIILVFLVTTAMAVAFISFNMKRLP